MDSGIGINENNFNIRLKHGFNKDKKDNYNYNKNNRPNLHHIFNKNFSLEGKTFKEIKPIKHHNYRKFAHCFK